MLASTRTRMFKRRSHANLKTLIQFRVDNLGSIRVEKMVKSTLRPQAPPISLSWGRFRTWQSDSVSLSESPCAFTVSIYVAWLLEAAQYLLREFDQPDDALRKYYQVLLYHSCMHGLSLWKATPSSRPCLANTWEETNSKTDRCKAANTGRLVLCKAR